MRMNDPHTIKSALIVDDEAVVRNGIRRVLEKKAIASVSASNGRQALEILAGQTFDLVFLDIRMPEMDGIETLKQIRDLYPALGVIMITGYPEITAAVDCIKCGALDYLVKPFRLSDLEASLAKLVGRGSSVCQSELDENGLRLDSQNVLIIGKSSPMKGIFDKILKVAPTDSTVLITGESGTGKELVAKAIHAYSNRRDKEFVAVDCSSLVENLLESELFGHVKGAFTDAKENRVGKFEAANKGTLFLDEIGNLSLSLQAKILAALQNRTITKVGSNTPVPIDIRLISATNKNLNTLVAEGLFREDLLYRINTITIELPPLRERGEDILLLAEFYLQKYAKKYEKHGLKMNQTALQTLLKYSWPGNVRELQHSMEKAVILADGRVLDEYSFSFTEHSGKGSKKVQYLTLEEMEKEMILTWMDKENGNMSAVAKKLGITRQTLYRKLRKFDI